MGREPFQEAIGKGDTDVLFACPTKEYERPQPRGKFSAARHNMRASSESESQSRTGNSRSNTNSGVQVETVDQDNADNITMTVDDVNFEFSSNESLIEFVRFLITGKEESKIESQNRTSTNNSNGRFYPQEWNGEPK